jgi:hypothetical protein
MTFTAVLLAAAIALQAPGKPFVSQAGGFRATLPGTPKEQKQAVDTAAGKIDINIFLHEDNDVATTVMYSDYPEAMMKLADPDKVLEGGVDGAIKNTKGDLLSKRDISINGYPGKEFEAAMVAPNGQKLIYRARIYLVNARLYQLIQAGPRDSLTPKQSQDFFKSFSLTNPKPAANAVPGKAEGPGKGFDANKPVVSKEGQFQLSFPAEPREITQNVDTPAGQLAVHMLIVEQGNIAFLATYSDNPDVADPAGQDKVLEGAVSGSIESAKATLISKRNIRIERYPGKEYDYKMTLPDGTMANGRSRIYLVGKRLYQVIYLAEQGKENLKGRDVYLNSFRLTKDATP